MLLISDNASYSVLWERLSHSINDDAWKAAATPTVMSSLILSFWNEKRNEAAASGRQALPAVISNGEGGAAAAAARILELERQLAASELRCSNGGGSGGGGIGGGGIGGGGRGGSRRSPGSSGKVCRNFLRNQQCYWAAQCIHVHAATSGDGQDVRTGVTARVSAADLAAALARNNNGYSRYSFPSLGSSPPLPSAFTFVVDSGAQDSLVTTPAGLHNLRARQGQLHGVAGGSTTITAHGDLAAEARDASGHWRPFDLRNVCVAPEGGFTLLSTGSICRDGAEVAFAAGGSSAAISFPATGAVFPLRQDPTTGAWVLQLRPRSVAALSSASTDAAHVASSTAALPAVTTTGSGGGSGSGGSSGGGSGGGVNSRRRRLAARAILLHRRTGHPGWRRLQAAFPELRAHSDPNCDCEICAVSKSHRSAISTGPSATPLPGPGEALTADLAGPFPRSLHGERYALILTDRGTRYRWSLPLKKRSAAAAVFDSFVDTKVRPRGYEVRRVRCDSGGEFIGKGFKAVCARRGIGFEPADARTPSQNSIAESSVRVLEATARCLALESGAPDDLWPFYMAAAAVANNCLTTAAVGLEGDAVPWQRWHGTAPPLDRLRVFGCLAWVNADSRKERRQGDKFGARAVRCAFLGCADEGVGWMCWDGKRVRTSVHVTFQEARMPWREKKHAAFCHKGTPLGLGAFLTAAERDPTAVNEPAADTADGGGGGGGKKSKKSKKSKKGKHSGARPAAASPVAMSVSPPAPLPVPEEPEPAPAPAPVPLPAPAPADNTSDGSDSDSGSGSGSDSEDNSDDRSGGGGSDSEWSGGSCSDRDDSGGGCGGGGGSSGGGGTGLP